MKPLVEKINSIKQMMMSLSNDNKFVFYFYIDSKWAQQI